MPRAPGTRLAPGRVGPGPPAGAETRPGGMGGEEIAAVLRRPREPRTPPAPPLGTGAEAIPVPPRAPHLQRAAPRSGPSSRPAAAQPGRRSGEGRARHMRAARRSGAAPETLGAARAGAQLAGGSHGSGVALRGGTRGGTLGAGHTWRGRTGGCSRLCSPKAPAGGAWQPAGAGTAVGQGRVPGGPGAGLSRSLEATQAQSNGARWLLGEGPCHCREAPLCPPPTSLCQQGTIGGSGAA